VCGTVVSTKRSSRNNVFLNLDKQFPNQIFTVTIFSDYTANFSYNPDEFLKGKEVCVTGKVTNFNGTPTMNITHEKAIEIGE
jgi:endonuclease G